MHIHFLIWASDEVVDDKWKDMVSMDLIAETPEKAMEKARKLLKRKYYALRSIIEHNGEE